jgi:hypothetical protein
MAMTPQQAAAWALHEQGLPRAEIAARLGVSFQAVNGQIARARKWANADPAIGAAATAGGISDPSTLKHFWQIAKDEDGNGYSLFVKNPDSGENQSFTEMVKSAIADGYADGPIPFEPRNTEPTGDRLLVIDLADVHFGKLCVESETGHTYSRDIARHRVVEGTKALLREASGMAVGRILFVMGNDILHTDDGKATTSGTPQDTDGSIFQMWSDAKAAITEAIKECAKVADVDLIHCMSNHDWRMGWTLSQAIAAGFEGWSTVNATEYNMSERHRKYYGFENNAFLLTHGDGTKEEKLYGHFAQEARPLLANCRNLYALLHHFHHKIRKLRGVDVFQTEKDHNGLTAIMTGNHAPQGSHVDVEYVRSPSPPDGWHDRNGYTNRQGVECFVYDPQDGMKCRFTEWF